MIPWIQVYSNLLTHPKTGKLVDALGLKHKDLEPECLAAGLLIAFWTWAVQNAISGDLTGMSNRSIAKAAGWTGNSDKFADAMRSAGFIDNDRIHDWEEYAVLIMESEEERKAKNRERVQKYRRNRNNKVMLQPEEEALECNADVMLQEHYSNATVRPCNAPTLHNITLHNITNKDNNSIYLSSESENCENPQNVENFVENSPEPTINGMTEEKHRSLAESLERLGMKDSAAVHFADAEELRRMKNA